MAPTGEPPVKAKEVPTLLNKEAAHSANMEIKPERRGGGIRHCFALRLLTLPPRSLTL